MEAVFQGELHTSTTDRESLLSAVEDDADALFIEQREDSITPDNWTLGYLTFVTGAMIIFWLQAVLYDGPDVKERVDVPVHDEIDTPLPELYSRVPQKWRLVSAVVPVVMFAYGLFLEQWQLSFIELPVFVSSSFPLILKPVAVLGAFLLFSFGIVYVEEKKIGMRDEDMANAISRISEEEAYEKIVVSWGQAHLERLPELCERRGWDVTVNESEHKQGSKIWRQS